MFFKDKQKAERRFNESLRDIRSQQNIFKETGRIVYIGKARGWEGDIEGQYWDLEDRVVICFENKGKYYKGFITGVNLVLGGFSPKYGQTYNFHSIRPIQVRDNYTLVHLSEVTSIEEE